MNSLDLNSTLGEQTLNEINFREHDIDDEKRWKIFRMKLQNSFDKPKFTRVPRVNNNRDNLRSKLQRNQSLAVSFMNSLFSDELKNSELLFNDDPDRDRWSTLYDKLDKVVNHKEVEFEPQLWQLLHEFRDRFAVDDAELTQTNLIEHEINTHYSEPYKAPWRPVPYKLQTKVQEFINDFLNQGIIQPSHSPWNSAIVLVKKKDGSLRFCVDFRGVNAFTRKDSYPLPNIDSILTSLVGKTVFLSIDLASGYWQIKMSENSKEKTAFTAAGRLWEWNVMPFGLTTAPATFQRLMNNVLGGLEFVVIYLDDILVCSKNWREHLEHLRIVFEKLRDT